MVVEAVVVRLTKRRARVTNCIGLRDDIGKLMLEDVCKPLKLPCTVPRKHRWGVQPLVLRVRGLGPGV